MSRRSAPIRRRRPALPNGALRGESSPWRPLALRRGVSSTEAAGIPRLSEGEYQALLSRSDMAQWLDRVDTWGAFVTVSFREPVPEVRASGVVHHVAARLADWSDGRRTFVAAERHTSGLIHCHGLVAYEDWRSHPLEGSTTWLWNMLFKAYGRSKVEIVRHQEAVAKYCAKYSTKALVEWALTR